MTRVVLAIAEAVKSSIGPERVEARPWRRAAEAQLSPFKLKLAAKPESLVRGDGMPVPEMPMPVRGVNVAIEGVPVKVSIERMPMKARVILPMQHVSLRVNDARREHEGRGAEQKR
jgi:hypothetical protein